MKGKFSDQILTITHDNGKKSKKIILLELEHLGNQFVIFFESLPLGLLDVLQVDDSDNLLEVTDQEDLFVIEKTIEEHILHSDDPMVADIRRYRWHENEENNNFVDMPNDGVDLEGKAELLRNDILETISSLVEVILEDSLEKTNKKIRALTKRVKVLEDLLKKKD